MLKNEREQYRKEISTLQQEVRSVQDKITRQSGALSNGLQDLKTYLDQKDMQRNQEVYSFLYETNLLSFGEKRLATP